MHKLEWNEEAHAACDEQSTLNTAGSTDLALSTELLNSLKPSTLHVSAIEAYQRCPRQYAYSRLYGFTPTAAAYQLFWRATQQTVESLSKKNCEQETNKALLTSQEAQELYQKHWQEVGGHLLPFAALYEQHGQEVINALHQQLQRQEADHWQLKAAYGVDIDEHHVEVTVDRVENAQQEGQQARFVRTRFGRSKEKPAAETRELFYMLASRQQHPQQPVQLQQHNMSTGEITPVNLSTKKEQSLYAKVKQALDGLARDEYPAKPEDPARCPTCPFFFICPT
jgi:DNA helicase II / ATP-dependent DNA helicase PcrA